MNGRVFWPMVALSVGVLAASYPLPEAVEPRKAGFTPVAKRDRFERKEHSSSLQRLLRKAKRK